MLGLLNRSHRIADKLFYGVLALLVIVLGGLGSLLIHQRIAEVGGRIDRRIETQALYLERLLPMELSRMSAKGIRQAIEGAGSDELQAVEIFDARGIRIYIYERPGRANALYERSVRRDLAMDGKPVGSFAAYFSKRSVIAAVMRRELLGLVLMISAAGLALGGGIFLLTRRIIVSPIERTKEFSLALADGHYEQRIAVASADEIGGLQESLNRMAFELEAYVKRLIEASRLKSEFLANLSHEIRTPMNAVIGFVDILLDDEPKEERRELLVTIRRSSLILLETIDHILQLSKMKSGEFKLAPSPFCLRELVEEEVAPIVRQKIAGKGVEFEVKLSPGFDGGFSCDRRALRQVLLNLLMNAAKFTQGGRILLSASLDDGFALFEVSDTGIGIPKDEQGRIFEPFTQVDASHTRQHGGAGLGLAISKQLVELMGGRIWLESEPEKGATFSFTVPRQAGEGQ